ncbi:MAG: hypothetical protein K2P84_08165 [Undibacterium sp.]|nr:hypothetical protein [Undibacterium sp.]
MLDERRFVPVSKETFDKITVSRDCLMQLVFIEEKFDFVIENLAAIEVAVSQAAKFCEQRSCASVDFQVNKSDLNRHLANLVALGRMFIDQSQVHVNKLNRLAGRPIFDLKASRNQQYDTRLGYRLFEQLRNYMLHRCSAVHFVEYKPRKEFDDHNVMSLRHEVFLYTSVTQLREDKNFKARVLDELGAIGDKHDLIAMARDYVAGLWDAQLELRRVFEKVKSDIETPFTDAVRLYAGSKSTDALPALVAVAAVARSKDDVIMDQTPIVLDLIAQRKFYELKNGLASRQRLNTNTAALQN